MPIIAITKEPLLPPKSRELNSAWFVLEDLYLSDLPTKEEKSALRKAQQILHKYTRQRIETEARREGTT